MKTITRVASHSLYGCSTSACMLTDCTMHAIGTIHHQKCELNLTNAFDIRESDHRCNSPSPRFSKHFSITSVLRSIRNTLAQAEIFMMCDASGNQAPFKIHFRENLTTSKQNFSRMSLICHSIFSKQNTYDLVVLIHRLAAVQCTICKKNGEENQLALKFNFRLIFVFCSAEGFQWEIH